MVLPVTLLCGHTFEKKGIVEWSKNCGDDLLFRCPLCNKEFLKSELKDIKLNYTLIEIIDLKFSKYRKENMYKDEVNMDNEKTIFHKIQCEKRLNWLKILIVLIKIMRKNDSTFLVINQEKKLPFLINNKEKNKLLINKWIHEYYNNKELSIYVNNTMNIKGVELEKKKEAIILKIKNN